VKIGNPPSNEAKMHNISGKYYRYTREILTVIPLKGSKEVQSPQKEILSIRPLGRQLPTAIMALRKIVSGRPLVAYLVPSLVILTLETFHLQLRWKVILEKYAMKVSLTFVQCSAASTLCTGDVMEHPCCSVSTAT